MSEADGATSPPVDPQTMRESPPPTGFHYEWIIDHDWEVPAMRATNDGRLRRCRYIVGPDKAVCGKPPVADLNRSRQPGAAPIWWGYCADHLFGRVLHDGYAWSVRTVRDGVA